MNTLDLILIAAVAMAALGGWRLGLIARALGWVGAILGIFLAISTVPTILSWIGPTSDTVVFLVTAATFVLLATTGQAAGVAIGSRLRPMEPRTSVRQLDSVGGSLLGVVGVLALVWLILPLMSQTPGWVASAAHNSVIARGVSNYLPEPPDQVASIENSLGNFPKLFAGLAPSPELSAPPQNSPLDSATLDQVSQSAARVQVRACGVIQSGSAFSLGDGMWVTNAHVVAGSDEVELTTTDGRTVGGGRVIHFDPETDVALVSSRLLRPALAFTSPEVEDRGVALGFPGGGAFEASPFAVGERLRANGHDIYDRGLIERDLLVLASELAPGDSGAALVDTNGEVIGIAVAIAPDRRGVAYGLTGGSVLDSIAGSTPNAAPVNTGECLR